MCAYVVCVADSAKPVCSIENSQQETDADVSGNKDCHSAELQDGWRGVVSGNTGNSNLSARIE